MNEYWDITPRTQANLLDQILFNRKVGLDPDSKRIFFKPDFTKDLHDPFLMNGISPAALRIVKAFEDNETVGIFADYDADGVPGAALLYRALNEIGVKSVVYIPDRESGYGLSTDGIDYLISHNCSLIITIDLGIRNFEEALYCKKKKIDLIITDHHLPALELPKAAILINPKIEGNTYPFQDLCGCGVAYKLISSLNKYFPKKINESFLKWNLDLVAISTIADVVSLVGENRILAKYGLIVLNKTKNLGLDELIKISGIEKNKVTAYSAGFQIAPRINAPGRIDHATKSFELLITKDKGEALNLAKWLNEKNESRQTEMDSIIKEAILKVNDDKLYENNLIILTGKWIKGIIGPSASRISELFCRPVILFADDGENYVGSARSLAGIDIVEIIGSAKSNVLKFGGHKGAAGLTVAKKKFEKFKSMILSYSKSHITKNNLVKRIKIDSEVDPKELTIKLTEDLSLLEPFGMGNPKPIFLLTSVKLSDIKSMGKDKNHLSVVVKKNDCDFRSVAFNFDWEKNKITTDVAYDIAFNLTLNEWNNTRKINLNIVSIKENESKS